MSIYHLQVLVCENLLVLPWKQKLKINQMIRVDIKLPLSFITPNFNSWLIPTHLIVLICISKCHTFEYIICIYQLSSTALFLYFGIPCKIPLLQNKVWEPLIFSIPLILKMWLQARRERGLPKNHWCRTGTSNQDTPLPSRSLCTPPLASSQSVSPGYLWPLWWKPKRLQHPDSL